MRVAAVARDAPCSTARKPPLTLFGLAGASYEDDNILAAGSQPPAFALSASQTTAGTTTTVDMLEDVLENLEQKDRERAWSESRDADHLL